MKRLLVVVGVVAVLIGVGALYVWSKLPKFPERPFTASLGPYRVGTREFDWTDSSRGEPYTKNPADHRRVVVQVWYPAQPSNGVEPAPYLLRPEEFADQRGARAVKKVRTNSVLDAPIVTSDSAFPILIYNHGGSWTRWSATFSTEWLASQGYVVFSVEHFGFNQTVRFPDGTEFKSDTLAFPKETGQGEKDALASWDYLDRSVFPVWEADARFTLDRVFELARNPGPFQGRLDTTRVGAFGWSLGGATGVQLSADDPRIKAVVDHDGQLFGDVREKGTPRPIMLLHHGRDDALDYPEKDRPAIRKLIAMTDAWDSTARIHSTADWFEVKVADTEHGNFSDLTLFYPVRKGQLDPRRAHEIINAYTLAFFDHYLKGRPSDLLTGPSSRFPEATFRSWLHQ
jgi:predicted dienelactone hydrolase